MVLDSSEAVKRWKRKLRGKPIAKQQVLRAWLWWCKTSEPQLYDLGPDGLINYQKKARGTEEEYIILDAIDNWLHSTGGVYNTLRTYKSAIRSFFLHNRAELSRDPTSRIKPTRYSQVSRFTIDEIRAIYTVSRPMMKAILICMVMSGMGCDELIYWSNTGYRSLMAQLEADEPLIRIDLPGRKKMKGIRTYYTFLGRDAVKALKEYLLYRRKYPESDRIFINSHGKPITYPSLYQSWMRNLRNIGLIPDQSKGTHNRYGKNIHELRDFYRTRWEISPASKDAGEYFMGHVTDPYGYNKAHLDNQYMKQEYLKAEPYLNVLSRDPTKISQYELIQRQNEHQTQIEKLTNALDTAMQTITMLQSQLATIAKHQ